MLIHVRITVTGVNGIPFTVGATFAIKRGKPLPGFPC